MINYNEISYLIYLPITLFITVWVGRELYQNGRPLMETAFKKYGFESWVSPYWIMHNVLAKLRFNAV